jgi:hypothetical protein
MGSTTKLRGEVAHAQHPYPIGIFLAEESHGARGLGVLQGHDAGLDRVILANYLVHPALDGPQLLATDGLEVGKVEAQPFGVHQRALLLNVIAQDLAQGRMHQVGGGVVEGRGAAPFRVHLGFQLIADAQFARLNPTDMPEYIPAQLLGIEHRQAHPFTRQPAAVTDLATRLGIEGGPDQRPECLHHPHSGPRPPHRPDRCPPHEQDHPDAHSP